MRLGNFQDNISIIDQNIQDFQNFLSQVKSKINQTKMQLANEKQISLQKVEQEKISLRKGQNSNDSENPQKQPQYYFSSKLDLSNFYSSKSKNLSYPINLSQQKVVIRNQDKLNQLPNKSFQQQKIKKQKQCSSQLIELKSIKELPSWLFQHIRKNNMNELKNRLLRQNKSINDNNQSKRYHQQIQVSQCKKLASSQGIKQKSHEQERQVKPFQQFNRLKQISSSFQIRKSPKKISSSNNQKFNKKAQDFVISEFQYSYRPQNEQEIYQAKINFSKNLQNPKKLSYLENSEIYQKQRSKSYRIKQKEKSKHTKPHFMMTKNRLTTVSEQDPLIYFHKN